MKGELFDLERLRKRWATEPEPPKAASHPKLRLAHAPKETLAQARARFARVRVAVERDLPAQRALMAPFFAEAEQLFEQLLKGEGEPAAVAKALDKELRDLDELMAVYFFPPRTY